MSKNIRITKMTDNIATMDDSIMGIMLNVFIITPFLMLSNA